jgi:hypothetical protein
MLNTQNDVENAIYNVGLDVFYNMGCNTAFDNPACLLAFIFAYGAAYQGVPALWNFAFSSLLPDVCDMVPPGQSQCSNYLATLNSYPESFLEAGVIGNAKSRWVEFRLIGDFGCGFSIGCQGRTFYTIAQVVYYSALVGYILSEIFCDFDLAQFFASILDGMDTIDNFWNDLVESPGDGIVPSSSQQYPANNAQQFPIPNSDSHPGETHSDRTRTQLEAALAQVFKVPTSASCTFSSSPAYGLSFSPSANTYSFSVSTQPGCGWDAQSQAPWISVSAPSGMASGTSNVTFSIQANTTRVPRTGTIAFGNRSSRQSFAITQNAVCTYSVSPSSAFFSASGGSATVFVSTQIGCVWSAVPQVSWITITAGQTGTNSGSFTFSVAANSNPVSLNGTILVAGQLVTVYVGSLGGSPGTGSANIYLNGSEASGTFCPYVCYTMPNSGTTSITVGGVTETASWSGYEPNADVNTASSLANAFNNDASSPVTARVSGSTIYFTAKFNGVVTNFPMSASYTWDTSHFSGPYVNAYLSGSSLTGGTD